METATPSNPFHKQNGSDLFCGGIYRTEEDEDFGPETDVDAVDDVLVQPSSIAAAKALVSSRNKELEDDLELQKQQSREFDDPSDRSTNTPTPPACDVVGLTGEDYVAESGGEGEDSDEEEWNYFKGGEEEGKENKDPLSKEVEDMESHLNPNAPVFIPHLPETFEPHLDLNNKNSSEKPVDGPEINSNNPFDDKFNKTEDFCANNSEILSTKAEAGDDTQFSFSTSMNTSTAFSSGMPNDDDAENYDDKNSSDVLFTNENDFDPSMNAPKELQDLVSSPEPDESLQRLSQNDIYQESTPLSTIAEASLSPTDINTSPSQLVDFMKTEKNVSDEDQIKKTESLFSKENIDHDEPQRVLTFAEVLKRPSPRTSPEPPSEVDIVEQKSSSNDIDTFVLEQNKDNLDVKEESESSACIAQTNIHQEKESSEFISSSLEGVVDVNPADPLILNNFDNDFVSSPFVSDKKTPLSGNDEPPQFFQVPADNVSQFNDVNLNDKQSDMFLPSEPNLNDKQSDMFLPSEPNLNDKQSDVFLPSAPEAVANTILQPNFGINNKLMEKDILSNLLAGIDKSADNLQFMSIHSEGSLVDCSSDLDAIPRNNESYSDTPPKDLQFGTFNSKQLEFNSNDGTFNLSTTTVNATSEEQIIDEAEFTSKEIEEPEFSSKEIEEDFNIKEFNIDENHFGMNSVNNYDIGNGELNGNHEINEESKEGESAQHVELDFISEYDKCPEVIAVEKCADKQLTVDSLVFTNESVVNRSNEFDIEKILDKEEINAISSFVAPVEKLNDEVMQFEIVPQNNSENEIFSSQISNNILLEEGRHDSNNIDDPLANHGLTDTQIVSGKDIVELEQLSDSVKTDFIVADIKPSDGLSSTTLKQEETLEQTICVDFISPEPICTPENLNAVSMKEEPVVPLEKEETKKSVHEIITATEVVESPQINESAEEMSKDVVVTNGTPPSTPAPGIPEEKLEEKEGLLIAAVAAATAGAAVATGVVAAKTTTKKSTTSSVAPSKPGLKKPDSASKPLTKTTTAAKTTSAAKSTATTTSRKIVASTAPSKPLTKTSATAPVKSSPTLKSSVSATKPSSPIKPSTPTSKPSTPTSKPSTPTSKPSTPTSKPTTQSATSRTISATKTSSAKTKMMVKPPAPASKPKVTITDKKPESSTTKKPLNSTTTKPSVAAPKPFASRVMNSTATSKVGVSSPPLKSNSTSLTANKVKTTTTTKLSPASKAKAPPKPTVKTVKESVNKQISSATFSVAMTITTSNSQTATNTKKTDINKSTDKK